MVGSDALIGVWHTFTSTYSWKKVNSFCGFESSHLFTGVMYSISRSLARMEVRCCCMAWAIPPCHVEYCQLAACLCLCVTLWVHIESGISHSYSWYSFQWLSSGHGLLNISCSWITVISLMRLEMALLHYLGIIVESPRAQSLHIPFSLCSH